MSEPYRRSALAHRSLLVAEDGVARLAERAVHGKLVLRGEPSALETALKDVTGLSFPDRPCRAVQDGDTAVLWIGPDEHWIVTGPHRAAHLARELQAGLAGVHHQLVDVSDYYVAIEVAGRRAREMLMKLTTLDLHPRAFAEGQVAGSMFAHAQAYLWRRADGGEGGPTFELFVRRTMAEYLWCLIAEAGREFGMPPQTPRAGETWRLER